METWKTILVLSCNLLGLAAIYAVGFGAFVGELPRFALSAGQLYSIAFLAGAWSVVTVSFLVNYGTSRLWGERGVSYTVDARR